MITQGRFLPKQMNGPIINCFYAGIKNEFLQAQSIENYLNSLSIDTAQETELENIGRIIGYPRPLVPEGFDQENILLLGSVPMETDPLIGLAAAGSEVGGTLSTTQISQTGFMDLGTYRRLVKKVALIKRNGITLKCVDEIASTVSDSYDIYWDENSDIVVHFKESIGYKNVWILTQIFYRIATEPQVQIISGALSTND